MHSAFDGQPVSDPATEPTLDLSGSVPLRELGTDSVGAQVHSPRAVRVDQVSREAHRYGPGWCATVATFGARSQVEQDQGAGRDARSDLDGWDSPVQDVPIPAWIPT